MSRILVVLALAAACAQSPGNQSPPTPDTPLAAPPAPPTTSSLDGGTAAAAPDAGRGAQAELMDPDAVGLVAASPDGNTALVNHRLGVPFAWDNDLWQVSRGQPPRRITASGNGWAYFSKDGSIFQYDAEDGLTHIARTADDAVLPGVTTVLTVFWYPGNEPEEWFGNISIQDGHWQAERIHLPDFARQVLSVGASPAPASSDVIAAFSPHGEAYLTCASYSHTPDFIDQWTSCDVSLAGAPAPLHFPLIEAWQFSPDGRSIVVDCNLYRAEGLIARACDFSADASGVTIFSADSSKLIAYGSSRIQVTPTAGGASVVIDRPCAIPTGHRAAGLVSPDGSRLTTGCGQTLFETSAAGGPWSVVATDTLGSDAADDRSSSFSPDSRVLQVPSGGQGIVLSVDGAPPRQVLMNDQPMFTNSVIFEPQGGHDRAIFFTDERGFAIGNQDGSGDWVNVSDSNQAYPEWSGHSVLAWAMSPGADYTRPRYDISVATATGTPQPLVANVAQAMPNRPCLINPTLWFIPEGGGLYAIPLPQP
jgi:hypothetical protein